MKMEEGDITITTTTKQNIFFRILMWILVFPIIFERMSKLKEDIEIALARLHSIISAIDGHEEKTNAMRTELQNANSGINGLMQVPYHFVCYYFTTRSEMINLTAFKELAAEIEFVPGLNDHNGIKILLKGEKKVIDELNTEIEELRKGIPEEDVPTFERAKYLLQIRKFKRDECALFFRSNLIHAMKNHNILSYRQLGGLFLHTFMEFTKTGEAANQEKIIKSTEEQLKIYRNDEEFRKFLKMIGIELTKDEFENYKNVPQDIQKEINAKAIEIKVLEEHNYDVNEKMVALISMIYSELENASGKQNGKNIEIVGGDTI